MHRAIPVGNKVCAARVRQRYENERSQRLREMKPQIDCRPPDSTGLPHLKRNVKKDRLTAERYDEIERCDRLMLQKMHDMGKKSEFQPQRSSSMPQFRTPGGPAQAREYDRIMQANAQMLHRLQNTKGELDRKKMEDSYERSMDYVKIACEYKNPPLLKKRVLQRRSPSSSELMRLPHDGDRRGGAVGYDGQDVPAIAEDLADEGGELRYVLRENRLIQEVPFFVEMATDGKSLAVSIYSAEADQGFELLLNEENHRTVLMDSSCDYGQVADRLYVLGDQLAVAPVARGSGADGGPTGLGADGDVGDGVDRDDAGSSVVDVEDDDAADAADAADMSVGGDEEAGDGALDADGLCIVEAEEALQDIPPAPHEAGDGALDADGLCIVEAEEALQELRIGPGDVSDGANSGVSM